MRTPLLSRAPGEALDVVAGRLARPLGVDASRTLWGTTLTRALSRALAHRLTRGRAPDAGR